MDNFKIRCEFCGSNDIHVCLKDDNILFQCNKCDSNEYYLNNNWYKRIKTIQNKKQKGELK